MTALAILFMYRWYVRLIVSHIYLYIYWYGYIFIDVYKYYIYEISKKYDFV